MVSRIGILGGTFDPPHNGHLGLAEAARDALKLDEVIWVPAFRNPLKNRKSTSAKVRLEMARLAVEGRPEFSISDIEISRGGPSYMVDTLEELQMVRPGCQWWVVMGADALGSLMEWRHPDRLVKLARIAAVSRSQVPAESARSRLPAAVARRVDALPMAPVEVSSTVVRADIALRQPVEHWLPPQVWEYIERNGLYKQVKQD